MNRDFQFFGEIEVLLGPWTIKITSQPLPSKYYELSTENIYWASPNELNYAGLCYFIITARKSWGADPQKANIDALSLKALVVSPGVNIYNQSCLSISELSAHV